MGLRKNYFFSTYLYLSACISNVSGQSCILLLLLIAGLSGCSLDANDNTAPKVRVGETANTKFSVDRNIQDVFDLNGWADDNGSIVRYQWDIVDQQWPAGGRAFLTSRSDKDSILDFSLTSGAGEVTLLFSAYDNEGKSSSVQISVEVTVGSTKPVDSGIRNISLNRTLPATSYTLNSWATDISGTIASYKWEILSQTWNDSSHPLATLTDTDQANAILHYGPATSDAAISIQFTATDTLGVLTSTKVDVNIVGTGPNGADVFAGFDKNVEVGDTVALIAHVTPPQDVTISTVQWTYQRDDQLVTIADSSILSTQFTVPTELKGISFDVLLQVVLSDNSLKNDVVTFNVQSFVDTEPPVVTMPVPQEMFELSRWSIVAQATDNVGLQSFLWSIESNPSNLDIVLSGVDTQTVGVDAPAVATDSIVILRVEVADTSNNIGVGTVELTIKPDATINRAPIADAGLDRQVQEGEVVAIVGSGSDVDGTIVAYSWIRKSGADFTMSNSASSTLTFVAPNVSTASTIRLGLTVTDDKGSQGHDEVIVTVVPNNSAPKSDAGPDITVKPGDNVAIVGNGIDIDGTISQYLWSYAGSETIVLNNPNQQEVNFIAPNVTVTTNVELTLTVTDNQNASATDTVLVVINPSTNVPPSVTVGANQTVNAGDTVNLLATADDADGTISRVQWTQVRGTTVTMNNPLTLAMSFVAPLNIATTTTFGFRASVWDDLGAVTASPEVLITVNPVSISADAGPDFTAVAASLVEIIGIGSVGSGTASYQWAQLSGTNVTLIGANTATVSFTAPSAAASITLQLTVTDSLNVTATDTVVVTVTAPNANVPPTANAGIDQTVATGDTVSLTGNGTDTDGNITSYLWEQVSGANVTLSGATSQNASFTAPNVDASITLRLTVTDDQNATASDTVVITVTAPNTNVPPTANAGIDQTVAAGDVVSLAGSGADTDGSITSYLWERVSGADVTLSGANSQNASFTAPNVGSTITLRLTVSDDNNATATDEIIITVNAPGAALSASAGLDIAAQPGQITNVLGQGSGGSGGYTFAWSQINVGTGPSVSLTNANSATVSFTAPSVDASIDLQLMVTDSIGATATDVVTITVVAVVNVSPTANAGVDQSVFSGATLSLLGEGSDTDGTISVYQWIVVDAANLNVLLTDANTANVSFIAPTVTIDTTITLGLTVTDDQNATGYDEVLVTIKPNNTAPIAIAGNNQTVASADTVSLDGSASNDPGGSIVAYTWAQIDGTNVQINLANTAIANFVAPDVGITTQLSFRLTVTDNANATHSDVVIIAVQPTAASNQPPTANAGADQTVSSNAVVSVSGSASQDDGTMTYSWAQIGAGGAVPAVVISGANSVDASFTAPNVTTNTAITLRLSVTDNVGATNSDDVIITVLPNTSNTPPIANAGINQTVSSGDTVLLDGSASSDTEGVIVAYLWEQTSQVSGVLITNASSANASFVAPNVNQLTSITIQLTVTDTAGAQHNDFILIAVQPSAGNVNVPPTADAGPDQSAISGASVNVSGSSSIDSDGSISSYAWVQVQIANEPQVTINTPANVNASFSAPNVVSPTAVTLQLTVTDNLGATGVDSVVITIQPANAGNLPPTANAGINQTVSPGELVNLSASLSSDSDGAIQTYLWEQVGVAANFILNTPNSVDASFTAPNVSVTTDITLRLTVTDDAGASATDEVIVTVLVAVNQPPVANAGPDFSVNSNDIGVALIGLGLDPENTALSYSWQQTSGPAVVLTNANQEKALFDAPEVLTSTPIDLVFTLTVTDADGLSGSDLVTYSVYSLTALSGVVTSSSGMDVDNDVNDPQAAYISNDTVAVAQHIPTPVSVGGYANQPGAGGPGRSQVGGDIDDYYHVEFSVAQSITLYIGDLAAGANDLDLYLLDSTGQTIIDLSIGAANKIESIASVPAGIYIAQVKATSGASNYVLTVGAIGLAVQSTGWSLSDEFVPGELIVKYKDNSLVPSVSTASTALSVQADPLGLKIKGGAPGRNMLMAIGSNAAATFQSLSAAVIAAPTAANPMDQAKLDTILAANELSKRSDVESVSLNYIFYPTAIPNDANYSTQWHYPDINLPLAWDTTTGDANVVVAVLDTGILSAHPDLQGQLVPGFDFISDPNNAGDGDGIDNNPEDLGSSTGFHGTHVAGTIAAASNNSIGVAGVAWGAKVMPLRVIGQFGTQYDIEQAIRYAANLQNDSGFTAGVTNKADIINLSLGGPANGTIFTPSAYQLARQAGVIIVAAAGNDGVGDPFAPAAYNGVVGVSATNISRELASYSNFGPNVDVAAPGGEGGDLNGDGLPDMILSTHGLRDRTTNQISYNYSFAAGTSMSAPHVSGVIALMKSVHPALTPDEFDTMLANGDLTQDLAPAGRDDSFGWGIIDAQKAVGAALSAAGGVVPTVPATLSVTPASLNFGVGLTEATIQIINSGEGTLAVTSVSQDSSGWLSVSPVVVDASQLGEYIVQVDRTVVLDGVYSATISVVSSAGTQNISVLMQRNPVLVNNNAGRQVIQLLDSTTGSLVDQKAITSDTGAYNFSFTGIPLGIYNIRSGSDLDFDGITCELGDSCGAYPVFSGNLSDIVVDGSTQNIQGLDFETGFRIDFITP